MGELEDKIKKELLKSGFPLQIFCLRCLLEKDWYILQSSEYYISENEAKKQIDVIGIYGEDSPPEDTYLNYELHVECKKSVDNPWVFFKDEYPNIDLEVLVDYESVETVEWGTDIAHTIKDLHFNNAPTSSIYTMAFRKGTNQIYDAFSSVLYSYQFRSDFLKRHREKRQRQGMRQNGIIVSFLTILFDGKLYLADVGKDDNINLVETNNIIYCQRETRFPRFKSYTIDVVTRDYFPNYLDILNKDRELISKFYRRKILKGGG